MKNNFIFICMCYFCFIYTPLLFAQVQDMKLSVKQFEEINAAKVNVNKIKKGVTKEEELSKLFGKEHAMFYLEEPITKADLPAFVNFLKEFIPDELKPDSYPFLNIEQKVLVYVFPWVFEHPVPCNSKKGECMTAENLVIVVTINKKTGIVDEFKPFDFHFEREFKQDTGIKP